MLRLQQTLSIPLPHSHKLHKLSRWQISLVALTAIIGITGASLNHHTQAAPLQLPIEAQLVKATNLERTQLGLSALNWNAALYQAATAKAASMYEHQYFDHIAPDGTTPWMFIRPKYNYETAGENLAADFDNQLKAIPAWMHSPSHRENILDTKYKDIAIVVSSGIMNGKKTTLIVQMFGEPATAANVLGLRGTK